MQKNILLPQVELEMESVAVVRVCVSVGERVDAQKPIIEVETQKATTEVPASEAGYVRKLCVKEGDTIAREALLAILTDTADESFSDPSAAASGGNGDAKAKALVASQNTRATTASTAPEGEAPPHPGGIVPAAPAARKLAADLGMDLRRVKGSGPGGRVTVEDVRSAADAGKTSTTAPASNAAAATPSPAVPSGGWTPLPPARLALIEQMRKSLAEIPQIQVSRQMDVTRLVQKQVNGDPAAQRITFTHRLILAASKALSRHAALRTVIRDGRSRVEPVSVAVAMDTPHGLVAPAVRKAEQLTLAQIATAVEDFRRRGESKSLRPAELFDAPFAITNLGMMGVDLFTPFVFHGQTAVLAVARATDGPGGRKVAWFTLAADHRAVDGAEAARFLETLQKEIGQS